jgi:hypothetical protein
MTLDSKIAGYVVCPMGGAVVDEEGKLVTTGDLDSHYVPEAVSFRNYVKDYLDGEGKTLLSYLSEKGDRMIDIKAVGSAELEDKVYAALIRNKNEGVLLSNGKDGGFYQKAAHFAAAHGLTAEMAKEYIVAHEIVHAHGYESESQTEEVLAEYFAEMAENAQTPEQKAKYGKLAEVAYERAEAQKNMPKAA